MKKKEGDVEVLLDGQTRVNDLQEDEDEDESQPSQRANGQHNSQLSSSNNLTDVQLREQLYLDGKSSGLDLSTGEAIRRPQFWILVATFHFNTYVQTITSTYYKTFGQTFISNDQYLSTVGSIASIFNAGGRVIWGRLLDKTNYKVCMCLLTASGALFVSTMFLWPFLSNSRGAESASEAFYLIWVVYLFFSISGNYSMVPATMARAFGPRDAAANYGVAFLAGGVGSVVVTLWCDLIAAHASDSEYAWIFALAATAYSISFFLTLFWNVRNPSNEIV